ncbi:hypothetical protein V6N11_019038 [Hibiscus sabdariffa]|uniref:Uncharacterized protein n=1 Tax=Hibiscus sabdariffa TaxID=183260 RepID=A0ABR2R190_9ROSI
MERSGDVITSQQSNQDFYRIMENYDVSMGVEFEDIPISHAECMKRPRVQSSNPSTLNRLPTDMVTEGPNTNASSSASLAKQATREP